MPDNTPTGVRVLAVRGADLLNTVTYPSATAWLVDDKILYVEADGRQVASYPDGAWFAVERVDEAA